MDQLMEIQLTDADSSSAPFSNILVEVHFFTKGNYRYGFKVGRTDETGHLSVTGTDIEIIRQRNAEENLMDYNTELADCDRLVKVVIPSEQQLQQQLENAIRFYAKPPEWAKHWPENGRISGTDKSVELVEQVTFINIQLSVER